MRTFCWLTLSGQRFKLRFVEHAVEGMFDWELFVKIFVGLII